MSRLSSSVARASTASRIAAALAGLGAMHLLAAQPGTVRTAAAAVDLGQSPGEPSASRPRIARSLPCRGATSPPRTPRRVGRACASPASWGSATIIRSTSISSRSRRSAAHHRTGARRTGLLALRRRKGRGAVPASAAPPGAASRRRRAPTPSSQRFEHAAGRRRCIDGGATSPRAAPATPSISCAMPRA